MKKNKQIFNLIFLISKCISLIIIIYIRYNMMNNKLLLIYLCFGVPSGIYLIIIEYLQYKKLKFDLSKRKQYIESILSIIYALILEISVIMIVLLIYFDIFSKLLFIIIISVGLFSLFTIPIIIRIINKKIGN